jgi:hypothetical protein
VVLTEQDLAVLDARLAAELARWPDPGAARRDGCPDWHADPGDGLPGGSAALFGGGFAGGGVLDQLGPGPALAGFSQGALDEGLGGLSGDELAGVLRASRRLAAWQDGIEITAVAELDARRARAAARVCSAVDDQVAAELAAALVLTGRSAGALLGLARDIARLPAVRRALRADLIDLARARIFAGELAGLGDIAAAAAAAGFAAEAGSMTTGQLRAALKAMVLWLDPAAARRRAGHGRSQARVEAWQENSGNAALAGRELPAADAVAADKRITAIAGALQDAGAPGDLDQLRAAVFAALLAGRDPGTLLPPAPAGEHHPGRSERGQPAAAGPGDEAGRGPGGPGLAALAGSVQLIMPAAAWLGLSDAPGEAPGTARSTRGPAGTWPPGSPPGPEPAGASPSPGRTGGPSPTPPPAPGPARPASLQPARQPGRPAAGRGWPGPGSTGSSTGPAVTPPGQDVPARQHAAEPGPGPAADLLLPRLPAARRPRRPGPHRPLRPGRPHLRMQFVASVPNASTGQARPRLDPDPARTRRPDLDRPARPQLHRHPRPLPRLTNERPAAGR